MKLNKIKQQKFDRELFICNVLIWFTFVMMLFLRFLNVFAINKTASFSQTEVTQTVSFIEANPIAEAIFKLKGISMIIQFIVIPGAMMTLYYYLRNRAKKGLINIETLSLFTNFSFFLYVIKYC